MSDKTEVIKILDSAQMGVFSKLSPATPDEIKATENLMHREIPDSLKNFYESLCNGVVFGGFKIIPVFSKTNPKKTAESLVRVNSIEHSVWFNEDPNTINQFVVFGVEGTEICYCFKVGGGDVVWQWERGWSDVKELDYDFWGWLRESLEQERQYLFR